MLIIDIETHKNTDNLGYLKYKLGNIDAPANYKDPAKIEQYKAEQVAKTYEKFALSPMTGKIILIGMWEGTELPPIFLTTMIINGANVRNFADEKAMLELFWANLDDNGDLIVTHNGKEFDFPFIYARSMLLGVEPTMAWDKLCNKYNNKFHADLYQILGEGKLQEWAYLLGATNTLDSEGRMVGEWYEKGNYQAIIDHCHADLLNTYAVAERVVPWLTK